MPGYHEIVKYIQLFDVSCEKMHMTFIPMPDWLIWHVSPTSYPSRGQILVIYTRWGHLALKWMPYANILLCMFCLLTTEFYWNTWIYCNLLHVNIYCVSHQASVTMIDALFNCTLILVYHDNSNCVTNFPAGTATLKRRWNGVVSGRRRLSTLFQRLIDVDKYTSKQRWHLDDESTLIRV